MRPKAFQRYVFTADIWDFVELGEGSVLDKQYSYLKTINIAFSNDPFVARVNILSEEPIGLDFLVLNIRDSNGKMVLGNTQYRITEVVPIINVFDKTEGYRHRAAVAAAATFFEESA